MITVHGISASLALAAVCVLLPSLALGENNQWVFPGKAWAQKNPEEVGVSRGWLEEFVKNVGGSGVVIKDGYLVYSWGQPEKPYDWLSAAKPVFSTLLFCAIAEGKVKNVDETIAAHWEGLQGEGAKTTYRHLADMTSGYACKEPPGRAYAYNDYAIQLYGKTLKKVFGTSLIEAGTERLAKPLEFQDGQIFSSPDRVEGMRVMCSSRDFARIGWLWVNRGRWGGRQVIPREMFDQYMKADVPSTMPRTKTKKGETNDYLRIGSYGGGINQSKDGPGVYGFNWWFNQNKDDPNRLTWPSAPPDTFIAYGRWGIDVMAMFPSLGLVVAADTEDTHTTWGRFVTGDPNSPMNRNLGILAGSAAWQAPQTQPTTQPPSEPK